MDSEKDRQKLLSMKEMISEKSRKNSREKQIEKHRANPFLDSKKIIQTTSISIGQSVQSHIKNSLNLNGTILEQTDQIEQELELDKNEIDQFQNLTLNSFIFRLNQLTPDNINSEESIKLLESINEFFKESKNEQLIRKFKEKGCLELLQKFIKNLEIYKPISYQLVILNLLYVNIKVVNINNRQEFQKYLLLQLKLRNLLIQYGMIMKLLIYTQIFVLITKTNKYQNNEQKAQMKQLKSVNKQILYLLSAILQELQFQNNLQSKYIQKNQIFSYLLIFFIKLSLQLLKNQLFSLLAFLCNYSVIEKRDYIRQTPLISYICRQIEKYSMNTIFFASIIVRNGIWLLVSLCSDLPLEGKFDYCKDAVHIFIRYLRCNSGTLAQECTWVLDTLISYYVSPSHPDHQQNIIEFIKLDLPFNLTETFKLNCLTTTQCALKILKQLLDSVQTDELKLKIVNEIIICKVLDLLKQQQRLLVFKILIEFIIKLTEISKLIQILIQCQLLPHLYKIIKNPDLKYNTLGLKALQNVLSNAQNEQLIEIVELGLFQNIKELFDQNENQMITNMEGLQIIELILEAGDCFYSNVKGQINQFKLKMDQSGLLQNIEDLQLSQKQAVSDKAVQIIERFCLQKAERIEEEVS